MENCHREKIRYVTVAPTKNDLPAPYHLITPPPVLKNSTFLLIASLSSYLQVFSKQRRRLGVLTLHLWKLQHFWRKWKHNLPSHPPAISPFANEIMRQNWIPKFDGGMKWTTVKPNPLVGMKSSHTFSTSYHHIKMRVTSKHSRNRGRDTHVYSYTHVAREGSTPPRPTPLLLVYEGPSPPEPKRIEKKRQVELIPKTLKPGGRQQKRGGKKNPKNIYESLALFLPCPFPPHPSPHSRRDPPCAPTPSSFSPSCPPFPHPSSSEDGGSQLWDHSPPPPHLRIRSRIRIKIAPILYIPQTLIPYWYGRNISFTMRASDTRTICAILGFYRLVRDLPRPTTSNRQKRMGPKPVHYPNRKRLFNSPSHLFPANAIRSPKNNSPSPPCPPPATTFWP